jgi:hypoxanthine phosphoribosyltransferase
MKKQHKKVKITWNEFDLMVRKLAKMIKNSRIKFDGVYGIPRGGLPLAVFLSHELQIPVLLYPTKNTLVVDDISDNGFTLERMKNKKIATLYSTDWTVTPPNWFVKKKESKNHWIIFPWEANKIR